MAGIEVIFREIDRLGKLISADPQNNVFSRRRINKKIEHRREQTSERIRLAVVSSPLENWRFEQIQELFLSPDFYNLIDEGKITFAMIKPQAHKAKAEYQDQKLHDCQVAEIVKAAIAPPLQIKLSQDFLISPEAAQEFYRHLDDRPEIFKRVTDWMGSGAVTGMLLYHPQGNAVAEWREQMGPTNPQKPDDKGRLDRLRHRFADSVENNVVHGSDSVANVHKEAEWFIRQLEQYMHRTSKPPSLPPPRSG